jgi:hypothetical protein
MDPIESTTPRSSPSPAVNKVLPWSDKEGSPLTEPFETVIDAYVAGGSNVLGNENVSKFLSRFRALVPMPHLQLMSAVEALSTEDTALLFHAISQYARYQTAAAVSTHALQEAQSAYQNAKEYQERCVQDFIKFKAITNKLSATSFPPCGQQASCTCFIVHRPQFSMTQAQRRLGVAQPEVTGGSPNSCLVGVVVVIEDYHGCHLYNTFVSFYSYLSSGRIHVPIFT